MKRTTIEMMKSLIDDQAIKFLIDNTIIKIYFCINTTERGGQNLAIPCFILY